MSILGIIPARGGSKGIPNKNLKKINQKSLLEYAVKAGVKSKYIKRLYVSTEDKNIKKEANRLGCNVINRPDHLARDESPTIDVINHVIDFLVQTESYHPHYTVLIQPTAPLRTYHHIDSAIEIMKENNCDSVISVSQVPFHYHPEWQLYVNEKFGLTTISGDNLSNLKSQRQSLAKTYFRNGSVYVFKTVNIKKYKNIYGNKCLPYVMPSEISINIDDQLDLEKAKMVFNKIAK